MNRRRLLTRAASFSVEIAGLLGVAIALIAVCVIAFGGWG